MRDLLVHFHLISFGIIVCISEMITNNNVLGMVKYLSHENVHALL